MQAFPDQRQFCQYAKQHNIVPVYVELPADLDTPVSIYYKLVGDGQGYILESADSSRNFGRFSFIGTQPLAVVTAYAGGIEIQTGDENQFVAGKPLEALKSYLRLFSAPIMTDLPQLSGGAVGYFAYEAAASWERVRGLELPEQTVLAQLMLCRVLCIMDHLTHTAKLVYLVKTADDNQAQALYQAALAELTALAGKLSMPIQGQSARSWQPADSRQDEVDVMQFATAFADKVHKAKEYIAAGDIFQVVLSQQFSRPLVKPPFELYRRLRQLNPSPYMFYLNFGQRKLVGASPEMLVKVSQGQVATCPIAGTKRRGANAAEDQLLAEQLLNDVKETAEHAMLVDLGRNDIGRVSVPGTVTVRRLMEIEKFSHVIHMVSEVTGRMEDGYTALDALQACFPAGTLSGAPKIRAMEIIDELEETARGSYGGAVGYIDFNGNMDTCITIRTIFVDGDQAFAQTGAGIVADSVAEQEYQEVLHKAGVLFQVLAEEAEK